jgi:hypothetical protein
MSNPKFGFADTVAVQKHVRTAMNNGELNVSQSFEICHGVFARAPRQTNGFCVNHRNQLVPIKGAITAYVDGKPVIACPLPETPEPRRKPLRAVSIDSLVEADGNVDEAGTHEVSPDDPQELSVKELQAKSAFVREVPEQEVGLVPEPSPELEEECESWKDAALDEASAETSDAGLDECE